GMGFDLEVHPPQCAGAAIEGDAALGQACLQAVRLELLAAPGAREEAAVVFPSLRFDHVGAWQDRRRQPHGVALRMVQATRNSGMGMRKRPPRRWYSCCWRTISSAKFHVSR